jgi:hypothetical protein
LHKGVRMNRRSPLRRHLVPKSERAALMGRLGGVLNMDFFHSLPVVPVNLSSATHVRQYNFVGADGRTTPVAIKDTRSRWSGETHGGNYPALNSYFSAHQRAVREGRIIANKYRLMRPHVYGMHGKFLVMEHVGIKPVDPTLLKEARAQLFDNLATIVPGTLERLQAQHVMPTGVDSGGRCILWLPQDELIRSPWAGNL